MKLLIKNAQKYEQYCVWEGLKENCNIPILSDLCKVLKKSDETNCMNLKFFLTFFG